MKHSEYKICTRCVMDTSVPDIIFDEDGVCNYCKNYINKYEKIIKSESEIISLRTNFHEQIKRDGHGKKYDCIVGVSGGADSSYALHLALENGLRPLAVHLDNGWNSELSQNNISTLVQSMGVDLYTHVIDWNENRDMQLSLIKAGVIDIEMIMDNAQAATTYRQALKYGLKHILSGVNSRTEGMPIPQGWYHYKFDVLNIKSIHKKFGTIPIKTHPLMSTIDEFYYQRIKGIRYHKYLDYFLYNKSEAMELLANKYGFVPYKYKHSESVFTRFYQNYILPVKFGVDKRKVHHSNQIITGQMTRLDALNDLKSNSYVTAGEFEKDKQYVLKKFGLTSEYFDLYIKEQPIDHLEFPSELKYLNNIRSLARKIKAIYK
jgi:N-acetyl sugar amidotransferase